MDNKKIADFKIADVFEIKSRGLVFAGSLVDGKFNDRNLIEFSAFGQITRRRIKAIEMIRRTDGSDNVLGLIISCKDSKELNALKVWTPDNFVASIFDDDTET